MPCPGEWIEFEQGLVARVGDPEAAEAERERPCSGAAKANRRRDRIGRQIDSIHARSGNARDPGGAGADRDSSGRATDEDLLHHLTRCPIHAHDAACVRLRQPDRPCILSHRGRCSVQGAPANRRSCPQLEDAGRRPRRTRRTRAAHAQLDPGDDAGRDGSQRQRSRHDSAALEPRRRR